MCALTRKSGWCHPIRLGIGVFLLSACPSAFGWGAAGHTLIGMAAEPLLCPNAAEESARFDNGGSLRRLGSWADQIRSEAQWAHTAPWHYVNIPDGGDPRRPQDDAAGNVIIAIEQFIAVTGSATATPQQRANALRFLVHFVADIHQPLHVGRLEDRGGNAIDVVYRNRETNLHYFWDSDVIALKGIETDEYARLIADRVAFAAETQRGSSARDWAAQVFDLRPQVYGFNLRTGALSDQYLQTAAMIAEQQIILAAANLANTLNGIFCP